VIKGGCFTNLDGYLGEEWPRVFAAVPQKGDWIKSRSGRMLKVVSITHKVCIDDDNYAGPYIEVELHK